MGKIVGKFFLLWLGLGALVDWVIMIELGVVHAQILPAVIPAGFGALFAPSLGLTLLYAVTFALKELRNA